jgi:hypothetical protein
MSVPTPRPARDEHDDDERAQFLATFGALYDRLREGSLAQIQHAAAMAERGLGGTVYIHLPSRMAKRDLPEAGYISDVPAALTGTKSMLP